jgi:hypothetical protein
MASAHPLKAIRRIIKAIASGHPLKTIRRIVKAIATDIVGGIKDIIHFFIP